MTNPVKTCRPVFKRAACRRPSASGWSRKQSVESSEVTNRTMWSVKVAETPFDRLCLLLQYVDTHVGFLEKTSQTVWKR